MEDESNPATFDYQLCKKHVEEALEAVLQPNQYNAKKVHGWSSEIVERTLKSLTKESKPYKYVVTAVIMQKNGAGLHSASTCFWDSKTDGTCAVKWENDTMHAIVSVFALHL